MSNQEISANDADMVQNDMADAVLSDIEKDALGEIGNICMGTCATTLSALLGKRVVITTPQVSLCKGKEYLQGYEKPVVAAEVSYTHGINGHNVLILKKEDALLITGILMGGGQTEEEIGDMYISAMSEVMNQMVGSSSTALADILHVEINISPPVTREFSREDEIIDEVFDDQILVRISFKMEIEGMLVSNIMQLTPYQFAKRLAASLIGENGAAMEETVQAPGEVTAESGSGSPDASAPSFGENNGKRTVEPTVMGERRGMELKSVKFQSFDEGKEDTLGKPQQNIDLIIDVPLQVTVVLGKTRKSIKEILEMDMGSVIVLDRLAGEMVDVLVNGKIFARGEVVVIDDNYGVRITEMMSGQSRM